MVGEGDGCITGHLICVLTCPVHSGTIDDWKTHRSVFVSVNGRVRSALWGLVHVDGEIIDVLRPINRKGHFRAKQNGVLGFTVLVALNFFFMLSAVWEIIQLRESGRQLLSRIGTYTV